MATFVLIIFFWEGARGYAVTNVPGYENRAACEVAAAEVKNPSRMGNAIAICVPGPRTTTEGR